MPQACSYEGQELELQLEGWPRLHGYVCPDLTIGSWARRDVGLSKRNQRRDLVII
jgi:hypothetical protein